MYTNTNLDRPYPILGNKQFDYFFQALVVVVEDVGVVIVVEIEVAVLVADVSL